MNDEHKYLYQVEKGSTAAVVIRFAGRGGKVLDLGAGPGSITRMLKGEGSTVYAVEPDPSALDHLAPYCEKVFTSDLNNPAWVDEVAPWGPYDAVVLADVLEHLVHPESTLALVPRILAPGGHVVVSTPNAGHNTVIACLIDADFSYRETGLLDKTHVRFFGVKNVQRLFNEAGFKIVDAHFQMVDPDHTELAGHWNKLDAAQKEMLERNRWGSVFQIVVKAAPDPHPETGLHLTEIPVPGEAAPTPGEPAAEVPNPRLVAFYLPRFHRIPESDEWWGRGFTDWTRVTGAEPLFAGHHQPRLPADLGLYDLSVREARREQIRLARSYGIDAFCYLYYWFSGRRLFEGPLEDMLDDPASDMPFCLCWANENWTTGLGAGAEVLIAQDCLPGDYLDFIVSIERFLKDPRYLHVEGAPVLVIRSPHSLPDPGAATRVWRDYCESVGIGAIHLCAALTDEGFEFEENGFDSGVESPLHGLKLRSWNHLAQFRTPFHGTLLQYDEVAGASLDRIGSDRNIFRTVVPSWDDTARAGNRSLVVLNGTPENYERWLSESIGRTVADFPERERLVFVNSWNNWAEGNNLEPDRRNGLGFLEATRRAKAGEAAVNGFTRTDEPLEADDRAALIRVEQATSWLDLPQVAREIDRRATGDPGRSWVRQLIDEFGPFRNALILGCGAGAIERELWENGALASAAGVDEAGYQIEFAQSAAGRYELPMTYRVVDATDPELPEGEFDLVINHGFLSRTGFIDRLVRQIHARMSPDGLLVSHDYVGPHRYQYPTEVWEEAVGVNGQLPEGIRQTMAYPSLQDQLENGSRLALHPELVTAVIERYFQPERVHDLGGSVAYLLLEGNRALHSRPTSEIARWVDSILEADRNAAPSFFRYFVGRPAGEAIDPAELDRWAAEEVQREAGAADRGGLYYPKTELARADEASSAAELASQPPPRRPVEDLSAWVMLDELVRRTRRKAVSAVRSRLKRR